MINADLKDLDFIIKKVKNVCISIFNIYLMKDAVVPAVGIAVNLIPGVIGKIYTFIFAPYYWTDYLPYSLILYFLYLCDLMS